MWQLLDAQVAVDYLRKSGKVSTLGLWGRSMGAVTALMYSARDPSIAGIVSRPLVGHSLEPMPSVGSGPQPHWWGCQPGVTACLVCKVHYWAHMLACHLRPHVISRSLRDHRQGIITCVAVPCCFTNVSARFSTAPLPG
jgi:hypothetical protein